MHTLPLPGMAPPAMVEPIEASADDRSLAEGLPSEVHFGTSTWSFPGWQDLVYAGHYTSSALARHALPAYAAHPLLRTVGVDRSYYGNLGPVAMQDYRDAVPAHFRFVVKAHEHCTWARFPDHARYGEHAAAMNARFLDPHYAAEAVVAPLIEGLADKLGAVVFQFPPQPQLTRSADFADRLHAMLDALPPGPTYAVELRNAELLDSRYVEALEASGAVHCLSVHPRAPALRAQLIVCARAHPRALVARWNLGHDLGYEAARSRYAPFDRMVDPDPDTRGALARACLRAARDGAQALVIVNNKAEGCAPASIRALAQTVVNYPVSHRAAASAASR